MAVTAQTNTTLDAIAQTLRKYDHFCICGHMNPDGDSIGSELALALVLRAMDKQVACLLAQDEPVDTNLEFLPHVDDLVFAGAWDDCCEVFIAIDAPTRERLGDAAIAVQDRADLTITIDHHAVPSVMSDMSYTDPDVASTTMLIWQVAKYLDSTTVPGVASCCYTGLMTDTGRFQFQNADVYSFKLATEMVEAGASPADIAKNFYQNRTLASLKLEGIVISRMLLLNRGEVALSWLMLNDMSEVGAVKSDAEPLVDVLRSVRGVRLVCFLRERENEIRGSLRAKDDTDVSVVAREFGGGGHKAAAGFSLTGTMEHAVEVVSARLCELTDPECGDSHGVDVLDSHVGDDAAAPLVEE